MQPHLYQNVHTHPPDRPCVRHWVHPSILVGGNLNHSRDWEDLRAVYGIMSVVNLDARSEAHLGIPALCECPVEDNGNPFSQAAVRHVLSFARVQVGIGPLYVHCHIGVSRSPAFAYGIMRWALDMSREDALKGLNSSGGEYGDYLAYHPKHRVYIDAVERAISG